VREPDKESNFWTKIEEAESNQGEAE